MKSAIAMNTTSDFITSFAELNDHIVTAIENREYERVLTLDKARQNLMQELILNDNDETDNTLIEFIDDCSRKNTQLIERLVSDIEEFTFRNNLFAKVVKAYQN